MNARRIGIVPAHAIRLEQLLQLPPGHQITSVVWDQDSQEARFAVTGPNMPLVEAGEVIPRVRPTVHVASVAEGLVVTWAIEP